MVGMIIVNIIVASTVWSWDVIKEVFTIGV